MLASQMTSQDLRPDSKSSGDRSDAAKGRRSGTLTIVHRVRHQHAHADRVLVINVRGAVHPLSLKPAHVETEAIKENDRV